MSSFVEKKENKKDPKIKHLWEFEKPTLSNQVEIHNCKGKIGKFSSFDTFLQSKEDIFSCNCLYSSELLTWYWERETYEEDEDPEEECLHLVFSKWFTSVTRIKIKVSEEDENKVRKYLREELVKRVPPI